MFTSLARRYLPQFTYIVFGVLMAVFLLLWQPLNWQIVLPVEFWYKQTLIFALLIFAFWLNTTFWIPRLLFRNRMVVYLLVNLIMALLVGYAVESFEKHLSLWEIMNKAFAAAKAAGTRKKPLDVIDYFSMIMAMVVIGLSTSLAMIQSWRKNLLLHEELKVERINTELQFLKAQINPHFFFNTLNNIYALTQVNVDAAGESIHKLSRMMRYVLYESQNETVPLSREIAFIADYIELMKLRLTSKVKVEFIHSDSVKDVAVAPMIMLPFIENAFKHGISSTHPCYISIQVTQDDGSLQLLVKNTLFAEKKVSLDESSGIGLVNTRRRLDLLYPQRYKLDVAEDNALGEFSVLLEIKTV